MDEELGGLTQDDFVLPPIKYEYLDHTADVQLHAWGNTLQEAFEQCGMAMFGYMTDLDYVQIKEVHTIEANADDLMGLLYHFLDELLFLFSVEPFLICKKLVITEFNTQEFRIVCKCYGEEFQIGKHPQGSEVKAITYSAMQIIDQPKDNKLHAWGNTLQEAFEQCGMAMFGYMTDLDYVQIKEVHTIEANADDLMGLLYHFLDELLFLFSVEPFLICKKLVITEFNTQEFRIVCKCYGEEFQIGKHPQGSEVKAITYSAMQIIDQPKDNKYEVFVIIDI